MSTLPDHLPQTVDGAAAHIYTVTKPNFKFITIQDLPFSIRQRFS